MSGLKTPAFLHVPERDFSLQGPAVRMAAALGRPLDDMQKVAVDALTGVRGGRPASLEACVISPRQNVKTWIKQLISLVLLLEPGGIRHAVWSAHLFSTAQHTQEDFIELVENYAWLRALIKKITIGNNDRSIIFGDGRKLKFQARSKSGGRGIQGDLVVLDEAFALQPAHIGALMPILSTRPMARVLYGSSAGLASSDLLRGIRDRGRKGGPGAPAYVEFCAPGSLADPGCVAERCSHAVGTPGCTFDREDYWRAANIAVDAGRISIEYLRAERQAMAAIPEEFARERLGWWEDPVTGVAALPRWGELVDPDGQWVDGEFVLTFDVSMNSRWASVGLAGRREDGSVQLEVLRRDRGTDWVVDFVADAVGQHGEALAVVANDYPTNRALFPELERLDVRVRGVSRGEFAAGCGWLEQAVADGAVRHLGDEKLLVALAEAVKADVGDGAWVWSRSKSGADISALVAVTVAGFALKSLPDSNLFIG